jgi:hypothetical protein
MNTNRTAARLLSFALAAVMTASMLAGINSLASNDRHASDLIARVATLAKAPA